MAFSNDRILVWLPRRTQSSAQGFYYVAELLAAIDERLPRAVLRSAFSSCVQPWRQWNRPEEEHKAQLDARRREVAGAIEAELSKPRGTAANCRGRRHAHRRTYAAGNEEGDEGAGARATKCRGHERILKLVAAVTW